MVIKVEFKSGTDVTIHDAGYEYSGNFIIVTTKDYHYAYNLDLIRSITLKNQ